MVWRGKGRRKAARALKTASGGPDGDSAGSPAPKADPPAPKVDTPAPKARSRKSKARSRTPLPKGRSSKRRDGGGRGGRGGRGGDGDDGRERGRMARPKSSPAPFIIAGAFILGAVVIVAIIASGGKESPRSTDASYGESSGTDSGGDYARPGGGSGSTGYAAGRSASAPARPRGGSTFVEIRPVHRGLSRSGDERGWTAACGRCGTRFTSRVKTCPNSTCGAALRWDTHKEKKCAFCCPENKLTVKDLNEIPKNDRHGFCAFCGGLGQDPDYKAENSRLPFGMSRAGAGSGIKPGACPVCKGSGKCMKCTGDGYVDMPESFLP